MLLADLSRAAVNTPVQAPETPAERSGPASGMALCLSGGGYRAMLFHLGALIRLNEAGILGRIQRISSVSGGSISAGLLGLRWKALGFSHGTAPADKLQSQIIQPICSLAGRTIDVKSIVVGVLTPGVSISDRVAAAYRDELFGDATLADLPDDATGEGPRFVLNATNVQTGSLWRFSRPFMGDYQVGLWSHPQVPLANVVAASSAFPPILSPCELNLETAPDAVPAGEPSPPFCMPPYTTQAVLTDGGVYDNLGLETAFKRYKTVLVSDGGMKMTADPAPHEDWALHSKRVLELIDNQVRSLRKRQLIQAFVDRQRTGGYWGIATHLQDYHLTNTAGGVDDPFGYLATDRPAWKDTTDLAATPTRLAALPSERQQALINWGYVVCDAALRAHVATDLKQDYQIDVRAAAGLPYPEPQ